MTTNFCHPPTPCKDCPFRREGGVRLYAARIKEIAGVVAPDDGHGGTFACHKTTGVCGGPATQQLECTGALIFAYKQGVTSNFIRIMERIGMVNVDELAMGEHPEIFDDVDDMLTAAIQPRTKARTRR